jgi:hypothetical protein
MTRMKFALLMALLGGPSFHLAPGDFRWIPFTVRQTPTEVECRFEVLEGNPSVHLELLPMSEFRLFDRGQEHETMATTPEARTGDFRRMIDTRGRYAVLVVNARNAPPATVTLDFQTNVNPSNADVARTLSPQRQLAVILMSFAFFLATVTWSSRKLIQAMRASGR